MDDINTMWSELTKDEQTEFFEAMRSISSLIENACALIVEATNEC